MADLNRFDLNLLVVLDAVLTERSVTKAADRLFVSQPAISGSLQRLRDHFQDKLLVRAGRDMELTPKAKALIEPLRAALLQIDAVLEARALFDPATTQRTFRIAMSDYCSIVFLPPLLRHLTDAAPGARIIIENVHGPCFSRLESGEIDLIITHGDLRIFGRDVVESSFITKNLFEDSFVCVVARDHPVDTKMTLNEYCNYPHAIADYGPNMRMIEDLNIERQGITIKEMVRIPIFAGLPYQLQGTNLIATIQRRLAQELSKGTNIRVLELPIAFDTLKEAMVWHKRYNEDLGHQWLRSTLCEVAAHYLP